MNDNLITIQPKSGYAFRLRRGDTVRVIDLEGSQVADLVAYRTEDPREHLSQSFTRMNNDNAHVRVGERLYSNLNTPLLTLVTDTVGVHDLLFPPCNAFLYRHVFGITDGKTGCREHLASALAPHGIGLAQVTDPFNVFMNTSIDEQGRMCIHEPRSSAGDHVELRAETDLLVGVSACAADTVNDCNGGHCTSIGVVIQGGTTSE